MRKPPKNSQSLLPGYTDYQVERDRAIENHVNRLSALWQAGLSGEKMFTARMLIFCGLPLSKSDTVNKVVRKAQIGDKSWVRVSFIRTHDQVPLPFGADRTLMFFLTNKAVLQQSPLLHWDQANEYMHLFSRDKDSGYNYRAIQERFTRLAYMDIMVEYLDYDSNVLEHWKCPMIDHARISASMDGEGNWQPSQSVAKMLQADQSISFGQRFFAELQSKPVPIPLELIRAAGKQYRLMDYMIFLYWRAFAAQKQSFIPWRYLQQQFDDTDQNDRRWPLYFRKALSTMKSLPDPISSIQCEVSSGGVTVHPYAPGTTFFNDQPKLGLRRALLPSQDE